MYIVTKVYEEDFLKTKNARTGGWSGNVLFSQGAAPQVSSGLKGLTAVFGMGTGVSLSLWSPPHPHVQASGLILYSLLIGGDEGIRTPDLCRARAALFQLSYIPSHYKVGLPGLEPGTSVLSGLRSNHLS
jgi:hypothetical protein